MKTRTMVKNCERSSVKSLLLALLCVLLCVQLLGCAKDKPAGGEETPSGEPTATLTPEATPEASPTPEATPTEAPSEEDLYWQEVLKEFEGGRYDLTAALTTESLKGLCEDYFMLGVGLTGSGTSNAAVRSKEYMTVTKKHFNSVTLTNLMKPTYLLDQAESAKNADGMPVVTFGSVDATLKWCMENGVSMRGHTLVWHTQTPDWFFREGYQANGDYVDRDTMIARLDSYIKQVLTYCQENYPGVIYCWDVVNEAVDPTFGDPNSFYSCRTQNDGQPNPWYVTVGDDYVEQAFTSARRYAAEGVKLFYNDFNTYESSKRMYIYNLCEHLAEKGLIDGIGMQGYWGIGYPALSAIETTIKTFAKLGLELHVTEMSINADEETPDGFEDQARRYAMIFFTLQGLDTEGGGPANITSVTLFGLMDDYVFYTDDTTNSRLFDGGFQPKPAFDSIQAMLKSLYK